MEKDPILTFDTLFSFPHLQILKIVLPLLPCEYRQVFAIYIKFAELKQTIRMKENTCRCMYNDWDHQTRDCDENQRLSILLDAISPYLSAAECNQIKHLQNLLQNLKQMKEIQPLIQMLSSMQDGGSTESNEELLKQFLDEEQLSMFRFFMNQNEGETQNGEFKMDEG